MPEQVAQNLRLLLELILGIRTVEQSGFIDQRKKLIISTERALDAFGCQVGYVGIKMGLLGWLDQDETIIQSRSIRFRIGKGGVEIFSL